jgi:hypothetical protein
MISTLDKMLLTISRWHIPNEGLCDLHYRFERWLLGDFNYGILDAVRHRPWPMPTTPWIMTQTWNDLLFAHWPVDRQLLATKVPRGLELDLFDGEAWLGIVPFHMTNMAPRLVPALPWISAFPELNVRT